MAGREGLGESQTDMGGLVPRRSLPLTDLARNFVTSPNANPFPGSYVYIALVRERKRMPRD